MADLTPARFRRDLAALAADCRREIETRVDGLPADPAATARRRERAGGDFQFFAATYFPHHVSAHASILHEWLYERLPRLTADRRGIKLAVAAPRGEAKSTIVTQLFTLWCVLTDRKKFIPIIMDAYEQAAAMLEMIKAELEVNPRLGQDFPRAAGTGPVWREGVIVTAGNAKIQVFGSGTRMRGLRHGSRRPDLVICDDLENDENVRSRRQRDKLEAWFKNAVLKLGPADDSMDLVLVGTVLHYDSLLARMMRSPLWESRRFQAIVRWPDDMGSWERWEAILRRDGEAAADRYYRRHRKAMNAGAKLSWPGARPLDVLMKIRVRDGVDAFDAELQNSPMSENATFGRLHFWSEPDPEWLFFGSVDPSMGRVGRGGDPSAILVGGFNRLTGILDVVEADIVRRDPDRIIADVIGHQRRYSCRLWLVETVQFQQFFKDELIRRSAAAGVPIPAMEFHPHGDKELRITGLQPHTANGLIRFHADQTTLLEQLRHFGEPDSHDDGPDALEMLWRAVTAGMGMIGDFRATGRRASLAGGGGYGRSGRGWGVVTGDRDPTGY